MNDSEYQKLDALETTYWWHVGRRHILKTLISRFILLPRKRARIPQSQALGISLEPGSFPSGSGEYRPRSLKILDVGCGTGENIKFLSRFGKVIGIDISKRAIEFCQKRALKDVRVSRAENLPFKENAFDLITMLDLLEHLEDEIPALKEAFRVLKTGGVLLITVPSYQFLWSEHDEALAHKRRYSKKELEAKVKKARFKIKKSSFAITTLFPPILAWRLFQKLFIKSSVPKTSYVILPHWLNRFFINLLRLEAWLLKYINLPFGVSLVCVAEK